MKQKQKKREKKEGLGDQSEKTYNIRVTSIVNMIFILILLNG